MPVAKILVSKPNGQTSAVNILTPMGKTSLRYRRFLVFPVLKLVDRLTWIRSRHAFTPLHRLRFVHFCQWNAPVRWPYFGSPQPREYLDWEYLMFLSNYNGDMEKYIDDFSDALGEGIDLVWKASPGWRGTLPVTGFREFIKAHAFPTLWYYSSYPEASTNDISAALALSQRTKGRPVGTGCTGKPPRLDHRSAPSLGLILKLRDRAKCWRPLRRFAPRRPNQVTMLFPYSREKSDTINAALGDFERGAALSRLTNVHFARIAAIESIRTTPDQPGERCGLTSCYLLFNVIFDGAPKTLREHMRTTIGLQIDGVLQHCYGYGPATSRNAKAFNRYLNRCRQPVSWMFCDYPDSTVASVSFALDHRQQWLDELKK